MEPLRQRRESLRTLRAVVERRRAGDHHVQARESAAVDLVDELTQGVEALLANVAAYALKRLDLVQHQHQPGVARVAEDDKQALEEAEGAEVVDLSLHAGRAFDGSGHVRLRTDPGEDAIGQGDVPRGECGAMCPQCCCKRRRATCHLREPTLHQLVHAALQLDLVVLSDLPRCQDVLLKRESPPLEHRAECSLLHISGRQTLDQSPIDGLQSMQRRLGLGDLDLRGRESGRLGPLAQPPGEERLAAPVVAPDRLELRTAAGDQTKFVVHGRRQPIEAYRECVETTLRDSPTP